jgi:hypothetical protein
MAEESQKPEMAEGWSKDEFPTSAKPIFKRVIQLIALILLLCFLAYYVSEHPGEQAVVDKREKMEEELLTTEQQTEESEPLHIDTGEYLQGEPFQGPSAEIPLTQQLKQEINKQQRDLERQID